MRRPRVIVTRAEREAAAWVAQFRGLGVEALNLPLIAIAPPLDEAPLQAAWREIACFDAVMFVSVNAVERFFAARPVDPASPWPGHGLRPRAWAPGPGTRQTLLAAGVPGACVDAPAAEAPQFDSEALWQQVQAQVSAGYRVLLVRGADAKGQGTGREWLSSALAARGARVEAVCAYRRDVPAWTDAQRALAQAAATDGSAWIFSSSEAVANLGRLLPGQRWSEARAIATHPRIATVLEAAGFAVVWRSRPAVGDMARTLESIG